LGGWVQIKVREVKILTGRNLYGVEALVNMGSSILPKQRLHSCFDAGTDLSSGSILMERQT